MAYDQFTRDVIDVIINEAKERMKNRRKGIPEADIDWRTAKDKVDDLNPRLYDYAKSKFPGLSDEMILSNAQDLLFCMENGGMLDGHPLGMRLDKKTGIIYLHVFVA